jgi:hypothetical protein
MAGDFRDVDFIALRRSAQYLVRDRDHLYIFAWTICAKLLDVGATAKEAGQRAPHNNHATAAIMLGRLDCAVQLSHERDAITVSWRSVHFDRTDVAVSRVRYVCHAGPLFPHSAISVDRY